MPTLRHQSNSRLLAAMMRVGDVRRGRHGRDRHIEMAAMQVDRDNGGLRMIDAPRFHGTPHNRGLKEVFSSAR